MSPKNRKTSNLVALGSAAVVAVYGAGFMRTAEAAQRFAEQSDERRVVSDEAAPGVSVAGAVPEVAHANTRDTAVAAPAGSAQADAANVESVKPNANVESKTAPFVQAPVAVKKVDATTAKTAEQSAPVSSSISRSVPMPPEVTTVMSASGVAVTPPQPTTPAETKVATTEKPVVAASNTNATTPTAAVAANPNIAPSAAAIAEGPIATVSAGASGATVGAARLKDGEFTGYGTSRHGDVEVYLETTDGKITYVKISQCLTQYSCSWISDLPRQVLARQSTKVDAVSGATQSANAFYYALVAALAKAK